MRKRIGKLEIYKDQVITGYIKGERLTSLGLLYNCSPNTVRRILVENGIEIRKPGPKPKGT